MLLALAALSDSRADRKLLRLSIEVENWEDLKNDLLQAFPACDAKRKIAHSR